MFSLDAGSDPNLQAVGGSRHCTALDDGLGESIFSSILLSM